MEIYLQVIYPPTHPPTPCPPPPYGTSADGPGMVWGGVRDGYISINGYVGKEASSFTTCVFLHIFERTQ